MIVICPLMRPMAALPPGPLPCDNRAVAAAGKGMTVQSITAWATAHAELVLTLVSAFVAVVSALVARGETRRQRRIQEEQLRAQLDSASLAWGTEAIETMGEAIRLAQSVHLREGEFKSQRLDIAGRLSALVDRGRLFFPNVDAKTHGTDREAAYRGNRPPILDALVYAYYETLRLGEGSVRADDSAAFLTRCRRFLVSELQVHLDPRRLDEVIERYTDQSLVSREAAMDTIGELGVLLDVRRPGILCEHGDSGWTDRVGAERRREILHDINQRQGEAK